MSLRRIKHTFLRLSPEEKVAGLGAFFVIIGIFMPWYSVVLNFDKKSITETGLGGDIGVLGFVVLLMAILALLVLLGENLHIKIPSLGYSKEQILFFLMGQSAFLILLSVAVYTKRSLEFTDAGLRFGIYLALIGALFGAFSIFAQIQKLKKKEVQEFFEHDDETEKIVEERIEKEVEEYTDTTIGEPEEESEPEPEPEEEEQLFQEEVEPEPEPDPEPEEEIIEEVEEIIEEITQEEEDISEEEEDIKAIEEEAEEPAETQGEQKDYFMREAGFKEEEKPSTEEEEAPSEDKDEKKDKGMSMGFYEDQ